MPNAAGICRWYLWVIRAPCRWSTTRCHPAFAGGHRQDDAHSNSTGRPGVRAVGSGQCGHVSTCVRVSRRSPYDATRMCTRCMDWTYGRMHIRPQRVCGAPTARVRMPGYACAVQLRRTPRRPGAVQLRRASTVSRMRRGTSEPGPQNIEHRQRPSSDDRMPRVVTCQRRAGQSRGGEGEGEGEGPGIEVGRGRGRGCT